METWHFSHVGGGGEGAEEERSYAYLRSPEGRLRRFSLQALSAKDKQQLKRQKSGDEVSGDLLRALQGTPQIRALKPLFQLPSWPPGGWVGVYGRGDRLSPSGKALLKHVESVHPKTLAVTVVEGGRELTGNLTLASELEAARVGKLLREVVGVVTLEDAGYLDLSD